MQLRRFLTVLRHRWLTVLTLLVGGSAVAAGFSFLQTPIYSSQTSVFFSIQFGATASELVQGATYTQNSVTSFAALATKPIVLDPVIEQLELDTTARALAGRIEAIAPLDTVIVELSATDMSPEAAAAIASAVGDQLAETVERLSPKDVNGGATVQAEIVAPATVERTPISPIIWLNFAAGVLAGLLAGVGLAFARETLDTRVRGAADVLALTDVPLLGAIGAFPGGSGALVLQDIPSSAQAEAYRQIRTNLQFLGVKDQARSIVITSALPGEGKSTVAANLALALAETSARVLLVDADLRRPNLATLMSLEGAAGLTTVLIGRADFDDVVQVWGEGNLHVLTSGEVPPNPAELLSSPAMKQLLLEIAGRYDVVILDTAPLLPVTDAAILSRAAQGAIVVANARRVRRGQLVEGLGFLGQVDARVLGIVLNEAVKDSERYGYTPQTMKGGDADARRTDALTAVGHLDQPDPAAAPRSRPMPTGRGEDEPARLSGERAESAPATAVSPSRLSPRVGTGVAGPRKRRTGNDRSDVAGERGGSTGDIAALRGPRPRHRPGP